MDIIPIKGNVLPSPIKVADRAFSTEKKLLDLLKRLHQMIV